MQSLSSTESFHWLLQRFIRSVLLLWHSLLIYRRRWLLFRKGNTGSLWMQEEFTLTSKKECTADKIGAHILSGGDCEGRGGSRHTCTGLLRFQQTCSRHQARSPERWRWQSSGAWRCPREHRVRRRPWELRWGPDTGRIPSNIHRQPRCLGYRLQQAAARGRVVICSRVRQILEGNAAPAMEEEQNAQKATKLWLHDKHQSTLLWKKSFTMRKVFRRIEIFMFFLNFLAAALSLKKITSHRHGWGKQRPSLGPSVCQESLHLT